MDRVYGYPGVIGGSGSINFNETPARPRDWPFFSVFVAHLVRRQKRHPGVTAASRHFGVFLLPNSIFVFLIYFFWTLFSSMYIFLAFFPHICLFNCDCGRYVSLVVFTNGLRSYWICCWKGLFGRYQTSAIFTQKSRWKWPQNEVAKNCLIQTANCSLRKGCRLLEYEEQIWGLK